MIRVSLPGHLRTLAQVDGEVRLDVEGQSRSAQSSTPLRLATRCYGERSVIMSPSSGGRS